MGESLRGDSISVSNLVSTGKAGGLNLSAAQSGWKSVVGIGIGSQSQSELAIGFWLPMPDSDCDTDTDSDR